MSDIVYSWNFNPLEVVYNEDSMTNVVNTVHWQLYATHTSASITVQNIGTVGLETPVSESFVPYSELTKEIVTGWVEAKLGEEHINNMKSGLSASISDRLFPVRGTMTPPWDTPPAPPAPPAP